MFPTLWRARQSGNWGEKCLCVCVLESAPACARACWSSVLHRAARGDATVCYNCSVRRPAPAPALRSSFPQRCCHDAAALRGVVPLGDDGRFVTRPGNRRGGARERCTLPLHTLSVQRHATLHAYAPHMSHVRAAVQCNSVTGPCRPGGESLAAPGSPREALRHKVITVKGPRGLWGPWRCRGVGRERAAVCQCVDQNQGQVCTRPAAAPLCPAVPCRALAAALGRCTRSQVFHGPAVPSRASPPARALPAEPSRAVKLAGRLTKRNRRTCAGTGRPRWKGLRAGGMAGHGRHGQARPGKGTGGRTGKVHGYRTPTLRTLRTPISLSRFLLITDVY